MWGCNLLWAQETDCCWCPLIVMKSHTPNVSSQFCQQGGKEQNPKMSCDVCMMMADNDGSGLMIGSVFVSPKCSVSLHWPDQVQQFCWKKVWGLHFVRCFIGASNKDGAVLTWSPGADNRNLRCQEQMMDNWLLVTRDNVHLEIFEKGER